MFWAMRKNEVPGSFEKKECFKACGKKSPAMSHDLLGARCFHLRAASMKPKSLQNSVSKRGTVVESFFVSFRAS